MSNANHVVLMGRLTRDPETRDVGGGRKVTAFGLAVNREYNDADGNKQEDVLFIDCEAWGGTGGVVERYGRKGGTILIQGHLKLDQWEDRNGGGKRSKISVVARYVQLVGDRGGESNDGGEQPFGGRGSDDDQRQPPPRQSQQPRQDDRRGSVAGMSYPKRGNPPPQNRQQPTQNAPQSTNRGQGGQRYHQRQNAPQNEQYDGGDDQGSGFLPEEDMGPLEERFDSNPPPQQNRR